MKIEIEWEVVALISALILVVFIVVYAVVQPKIGCGQYSEITGKETRFSFTAGCFVKTERGFMPLTELEKRAITNE